MITFVCCLSRQGTEDGGLLPRLTLDDVERKLLAHGAYPLQILILRPEQSPLTQIHLGHVGGGVMCRFGEGGEGACGGQPLLEAGEGAHGPHGVIHAGGFDQGAHIHIVTHGAAVGEHEALDPDHLGQRGQTKPLTLHNLQGLTAA